MALNLAQAAELLPLGESQTLVIGSTKETRGSIDQHQPSSCSGTRVTRAPASPEGEFQAQPLQRVNSEPSAATAL